MNKIGNTLPRSKDKEETHKLSISGIKEAT